MTKSKEIGVINFRHGVVKKFHTDTMTWDDIGYVPGGILKGKLTWNYRVCAEGDGKVYVLDTKNMHLDCLDMATMQWKDTRPVDTSYRVKYSAMAYCNGKLYLTGGKSVGPEQEIMSNTLSLMVHAPRKSGVLVQEEPNMIYRRNIHQMVAVAGKILVCGGQGSKGPLSQNEMFHLATRTWSRWHDLPEASCSCCLVPNGTNSMFALGGVKRFDRGDESPVLSDMAWIYDWETQR